MKRLRLPVLLLLCLSGAGGVAYDLDALRADSEFFTDASCCQLKPGVSSNDLASFHSDLSQDGGGRPAGGSV
jgi:hypothetical protein